MPRKKVSNRSTKWIEKGKKRHDEEKSKEQEIVDDVGGGMAQLAVVKNKFKTKTHKEEEPKKPMADTTKNGVSLTAKKDDPSAEEDAKNGSASATAKKNDDDSISSEEIGSYDESESDDTSDEKEDAKNRSVAAAPAPAPKYAWAQKMDLSHCIEPQPPIPPLSCGSRLLYMSNLNPSIKESDVRNFFKDVGKVVSVEFGLVGRGHVRFKTYDEARQALKCNGEMLKGWRVKLCYSEERTIWDLITPNPEYKYLFMGNLSPSIKKSDVVKFFKDDGTVKLVRLMTDNPYLVGYGHVKFASFNEALKAVQRDGDKLLDHSVELVLASESTVWHAYTPSSRKPRGFGIRRVPGYGSTERDAGTLRYR